MLDDRQEDRAPHRGQHEEGGEVHVVLEEPGELVVVERHEEESHQRDEDDEHQRVEERPLELLADGVGGALDVDEVGGGADRGGGGRRGGEGVGGGEGVDEEDDEEHADGDRRHDADDLDADRVEDARFHLRAAGIPSSRRRAGRRLSHWGDAAEGLGI